MSFAFFAHFAFGSDAREFASIWRTMAFQIGALFGDVNYDQLYSVNRIMGPAYYFLFLLVMTLVIINVFIGIVSSAYDEMSKTAEYKSMVCVHLYVPTLVTIFGTGKRAEHYPSV